MTTMADVHEVRVAPARLERWTANFLARHGATAMNVAAGSLVGFAQDGSTFRARLPFAREYDGPASTQTFAEAAVPPEEWGVLLVRKGGFAVARIEGERIAQSKVGQRHVQGRSKAGGWSQKRFARRRDNQARIAYEAAAQHAGRLLGNTRLLITGGDHSGVAEVLEIARLGGTVIEHLPGVREPRRGVFEEAVLDACALRLTVSNS